MSSGISWNIQRVFPGQVGKLALSNFSGVPTGDLTLRNDGKLELSKKDTYYSAKEFVVSVTSGSEHDPDLAVDSKGNFMVVWHDSRNDTADIFGQRMSSNGDKLGPEFMVGTNENQQWYPSIDVDPNDNYVVAWEDFRYVRWGIYAQRLDSNGNKNGSEIWVTDKGNGQVFPSVACGGDGRSVIVWEDDTPEANLSAQILDRNGTKVGPNFNVSRAPGYQRKPCVDIDNDGNILIAWQDNRSGQYDIYAQWFYPNWTNLTSEFLVCGLAGNQTNPVIAINSLGNAVIIYLDGTYSYSPRQGLYAKIIDINGNVLENEIAAYTAGAVLPSDVAITSDDSFVIGWGVYIDDYHWPICIQLFDKNGTKIGPITEAKYNPKSTPVIGRDSSDNLVYAYATGNILGGKLVHPYCQSGWLTTGDIDPPASMVRWLDVSAIKTLGNASNSISLEYSATKGASWIVVPSNGSLSDVSPTQSLRFRATFRTADNITTPVLSEIDVQYVYDKAPTVALGPDISGWRNAAVSLKANGSDEDNDTLTYSWSKLAGPPLSYQDTITSILSFRPNASGVYKFKVVASDGIYESNPAFINVTVSNRPPVVSNVSDVICWKLDQAYLNASGTDPDEDALTFIWSQVEGNFSYFTDRTGESVSFLAEKAGYFRFELVANDGEADSSPAFVNLTVWSKPPAARLTATPTNVTVNGSVRFNASGSSDSDGAVVAYKFDFGDGTASGWQDVSTAEHNYSAPGTYKVSVAVRDDDGNESTSNPVNISVTQPANRPPKIASVSTLNATVGKEFTFQVPASDEDGDNLVYSLSTSIENMSMNASSGLIKWTPDASQKGVRTIVVLVSDGKGGSAERNITIQVNDTSPIGIRPSCTITIPTAGGKISGKAKVQGTAKMGSIQLSRVEVSIDGGEWQLASGAENWTFDIDSVKLSSGKHTIQARSYDGVLYSEPVTVEVMVDNLKEEPESGILIPIIIVIVAICIAGGLAAFLMRRKKGSELAAEKEVNPPEAPDSKE